MHLVPIDSADSSVLREAVAIETRATRAVRASWTPLPVRARMRGLIETGDWSVRMFGVRDGARLVGFGRSMVASDSPTVGWVFVDVEPAYERRGIGRWLAREAEASLAGTVERVVSRAYRRDRAHLDRLVQGFVAPLGFAVASTETVVELDMSSAPQTGGSTPPGYRLSTYVDGVPAALREPVGRLIGLVDADAPNGTLAWEAMPQSPAAYDAEIGQRRERGCTTVETIALASDDELAAWTCVVVPPNADRAAETQGTIVLPAHRGRGLGKAVKHANLRHMRDMLRVARVVTSSDDANIWMRAINADLGFRPIESEAIFDKLKPAAQTKSGNRRAPGSSSHV